MAEIFGILAGVAGIADVGIRVSRRLHRVAREWKHAPDEILALSREVSDLTAVLHSTQDACKSVWIAPSASPELAINLRLNTDRAASLLDEIDNVVQVLVSTKNKLERRTKWLGMRSTLEKKKQDLRSVRVNINDLLRAQRICSDVRVELELVSLQTNLQQAHDKVSEKLEAMSQSFSELNRRISDMHLEFSGASRASTTSHPDGTISQSVSRRLAGSQTDDGSSGIFSVSTVYRSRQCGPGPCTCSCHSAQADKRSRGQQQTWKTPPLLRNLVGVFFAQYSGSPAASCSSPTTCDNITCQRSSTSHSTIEIIYDFPLWCLNWGIHILVQWGMAGCSPTTMTLTPRYRVTFRAGGLFHAVNSSNVDQVRTILEQAPYSVHYQSYQTGYTALHYACLKYDEASVEIMRLLLRAGADFDAENDNGQSAGTIAACQILLGLMPKELQSEISNWASLSRLVDQVELSPVSEVVLGVRSSSNSRHDIDSMLKNMSPSRLNLQGFDNTGNTPLYWAARAGDLPAVRAIVLAGGVDINIRTQSGKTPLIGACDSTTISKSAACFRWLLDNGADPYQVDANGFNCLTSACCRRTLPAVRELLSWGVDVNTRDALGRTGLGCAAQFDQDHIVSFLLDQNADTEIANHLGWTPILDAVLNNSHKCLGILLRRGADYGFVVGRYGWTILHCVAQAGDLRTMEMLRRHGLEGVDVERKSRMYGYLTAEELFVRNRGGARGKLRDPRVEELREAFARLVGTVRGQSIVLDEFGSTSRYVERGEGDEDTDGSETEDSEDSEDDEEEIFYDAVEYFPR